VKYEMRPAQDLFVVVCDDSRVYRLCGYGDRFPYLEGPKGETIAALKTDCRVGEARHWRDNFATAWASGGGESVTRRAR